MAKEPTTVTELLQSWDRRALKAVDAHYESSRYFARMNACIGVPNVVLATIICGLAFATVGKPTPLWVQMSIGFLALVQAVLAALHTWLRHAEVAEKHRQAGARYAAVRRQIEQVRISAPDATPGLSQMITEIRDSLDALAREAPSIPARIWATTQRAYKGHGTADGKILNPEEPERSA